MNSRTVSRTSENLGAVAMSAFEMPVSSCTSIGIWRPGFTKVR